MRTLQHQGWWRWYTFALGYALPMCLIIGFYTQVIFSLWRTQRNINRWSSSPLVRDEAPRAQKVMIERFYAYKAFQ